MHGQTTVVPELFIMQTHNADRNHNLEWRGGNACGDIVVGESIDLTKMMLSGDEGKTCTVKLKAGKDIQDSMTLLRSGQI